MSDIDGGLGPAISQTIDLDSAPIINRRIPLVERVMTVHQAAAYQKGEIPAPIQHSSEQALPPLPPPVPVSATVPVAQQTIPIPGAPVAPTSDNYPARVNDRIGKIWGQYRGEQERAAALEAQLIETNRRLDQLMSRGAPAPEAQPYTNQYGSYTPQTQAQPGSPPAGDYVSRQEMQAWFARSQQVANAEKQLASSQNAARVEAERDFPDVFANPELNARAAQIWTADPALQADPHGPWKVAAMVRGISAGFAPSGPALSTVADLRKTALSGVGVSVPEGSGAASPDQAYHQARQRALATGRQEDWARVFALAKP